MNKNLYLIGIGAVAIIALGWFAFSQGLFNPSEVSAPDVERVSDGEDDHPHVDDVEEDHGHEDTSDEENADGAMEGGENTTESDNEAMELGDVVISFTGSAYLPSTLEIDAGTSVTFKNDSGSRTTWPASAIHPTHTVYPGSSIGKCNTEEADIIFDACSSLTPGDSWSFTFDEVGEWKYHDHLKPSITGSITVN